MGREGRGRESFHVGLERLLALQVAQLRELGLPTMQAGQPMMQMGLPTMQTALPTPASAGDETGRGEHANGEAAAARRPPS